MSTELDLDDIALSSSGSETLDDVSGSTTEPSVIEGDTTGAASSTAQGVNDEFDPLSIVRNVVDKRKEPDAVSPTEGGEGKDQALEGATQAKPDDEEFTDVPFHKHPRFQQLLRQKKTYEQDAGRYRNVQDYIDQQGLTASEAADGLLIMGLAKTDPRECWKMLKPFVEKVIYAAGEALPQDLQQAVDAKQISQELAMQYSRERAGRQALEGRSTIEKQRREANERQQVVDGMKNAAVDWEADRTRKDPNFAAKTDAIAKEVAWLQRQEGLPKDAEGVREMLEKAYKNVNAALTPARQQNNGVRPPIRPVVGGQVSGNTRVEPKSTLEIIRANRAS